MTIRKGLLCVASALSVVLTVLGGSLAASTDEKESALPKCPIMGEEVNFAVSADTPDGPVYFCCAGCIKKYTADPAKYAASVAEQRKLLAGREKVQVKCPIEGKASDPKITATHGGKSISFCSAECSKKFQAEPGKYAAGLANAYTYQTQCPVMGETVSPKGASKLPTGETIYYCCPGCDKKFLADPAKYASNLEKQGVYVNVEKLNEMLKGGKKDGQDHDHDDHDHGDHDDK